MSPIARTISTSLGVNCRTILSVILVLAILLPGTGVVAATAQETTFRCGIRPFATTNPLNADEGSLRVLNLIYDSATKVHPTTGERIPYIAVGSANLSQGTRSISWADCAVGNFGYCPESTWDDPTRPEIIIFYDFEDVFWQDGEQMDIRDIMFSFHVHANPPMEWLGHPLIDLAGREGSNYSEEQWLFIQNVWESEDCSRAALKFTLQEPKYSVFENYLSSIILPYHIWGNTVANQETDSAMIWCDPEYNISDEFSWKRFLALQWENPSPVGSGLFSWGGMSGNIVTLKPWRGHFYKPGFKYYDTSADVAPTPEIDTLSLHTYISRESALSDIETNIIDCIAWDLSLSEIDRLTENMDLEYRTLRSTSQVYMGFNMRRKSFGYILEYDGSAPLGTDYGKPLRKALMHCLDTQSFIALFNPLAQETDAMAAFSAWDNSSAPSYSYDPQEAARILKNAGYLLDIPASPPGEGNWWSNPDGSKIGRGLGGKIELLTTEPSYDPNRYQVGTALVTQMRAIGINIGLVPIDISALANRLDDRDFDMCIMGQEFSSIHTARPDTYYFSAFHSFFIGAGPNYCGYDNYSFDKTISIGIGATDLQTKRISVLDAMATVAYDLPIAPLYYETNTEIFRAGSFAGLVDDGTGSLLNPRSMASVFRQETPSLRAKIMGMPLTGLSNSTHTVSVKVTDINGNVLQGADVVLNTSAGQLLNLTGKTDAYGMFSTNYTAPYVALVETYSNSEAVTISVASAVLAGYRPAQPVGFTITVFPERTRSMFIEAAADPDTITAASGSGNPGFAHINIMVRDGANMPVNGAVLKIAPQDQNVTLSETEIRTDDGGSATITVYAAEVLSMAECTLTIEATKGGFRDAAQNVTLTVLPYVAEAEEPGAALTETLALPIVIVMGVLATAGTIYRLRKGRRGK